MYPLESYTENGSSCLVVGLGGGALAANVSRKYPNLSVDVVELDDAIIRVAQDHFEFKPSESLRVIHEDGLSFIRCSPRDTYSVIMLDVDNKDRTLGLSCPPQPFIQRDFLHKIKEVMKDN
ncbi:Methyltransferase like 13, partial [Caligus rogercresseyi]